MDNESRSQGTPSDSSSDSKLKPLNPKPKGHVGRVSPSSSLNSILNTDYVDVGPDADSLFADVTRFITGIVSQYITPRQLLILLRVLKAVTFCFLVLNIVADLMFMIFLDIMAEKDVRNAVGGSRDLIIRIYGLGFAILAIMIELDYAKIVKSFRGFKYFVPRALLIFFVSAITGTHPIHDNQAQQVAYDDQYVAGDDDDSYTASVATEIPKSAVMFQVVTSFIL
jgi:hypothetical protein